MTSFMEVPSSIRTWVFFFLFSPFCTLLTKTPDPNCYKLLYQNFLMHLMVLSSEVWTREELAGTQHTWVTWTEERGKMKNIQHYRAWTRKVKVRLLGLLIWLFFLHAQEHSYGWSRMIDTNKYKDLCAQKQMILFSPGFERCCVSVHILQILCPTGTSSCHESRCIAFSPLQATRQTVPYAQISSIRLKHQLNSTTQTNVLTPIKTILRKSVISNRSAFLLHIENVWKNKDRDKVPPKNM